MNPFTVTLVKQISQGTGRVFLNFDKWSDTVDFYVTDGIVVDDPSEKEPIRKVLTMPWLQTVMPFSQSIRPEVKDFLQITKIQEAIYSALLELCFGQAMTDKVIVNIEPILQLVDSSKRRQAVIDADGHLLQLREAADYQYPSAPAPNGEKLLLVIVSDFRIPDEKLLYELTCEQQRDFSASPYVYRLRPFRAQKVIEPEVEI